MHAIIAGSPNMQGTESCWRYMSVIKTPQSQPCDEDGNVALSGHPCNYAQSQIVPMIAKSTQPCLLGSINGECAASSPHEAHSKISAAPASIEWRLLAEFQGSFLEKAAGW